MSEKQPEALLQASILEVAGATYFDHEAAAEPRRQYALLEEMAGELSALLFLIRFDPPRLSGETLGRAVAVLAKWEASK